MRFVWRTAYRRCSRRWPRLPGGRDVAVSFALHAYGSGLAWWVARYACLARLRGRCADRGSRVGDRRRVSRRGRARGAVLKNTADSPTGFAVAECSGRTAPRATGADLPRLGRRGLVRIAGTNVITDEFMASRAAVLSERRAVGFLRPARGASCSGTCAGVGVGTWGSSVRNTNAVGT